MWQLENVVIFYGICFQIHKQWAGTVEISMSFQDYTSNLTLWCLFRDCCLSMSKLCCSGRFYVFIFVDLICLRIQFPFIWCQEFCFVAWYNCSSVSSILQACDASCYAIYWWGYKPGRNQYYLDLTGNLLQEIRYFTITFCHWQVSEKCLCRN
jgi:hypothetical protein